MIGVVGPCAVTEHDWVMPDRSSKRPRDVNSLAARLVAEAVGDEAVTLPPGEDIVGKNPAAVALGRLGGQKGGIARATSLTPEQRSEIAKKAAAKGSRQV
jgi:hypothetical protein